MGELDAASSSGAAPPNEGDLDQFVATGRTGRRNAMAELGLEQLDPGAYKLAAQLAQLDTSGGGASCGAANGDAPSTSADANGQAGTSGEYCFLLPTQGFPHLPVLRCFRYV
ncbi:hypothetical protein AAVH_03598 [Aphelenchoides avenae]|nr:hypothetical protein AAVH_03598 [Aphelenchus avenae]